MARKESVITHHLNEYTEETSGEIAYCAPDDIVSVVRENFNTLKIDGNFEES